MNDVAAGRRLRRYLREGMASVGIESIAELARRSDVGRDTLQVWLRGERAPSTTAGTKVANAINSTYAEMLRAWEGEEAGELEAERIVEALEYAIRLVRAGQVPPEVRREVEQLRRSGSPRRQRCRRA